MRKIYKYKLKITDEQMLTLPKYSEYVNCSMQDGELCVWILVDPDEKEMFTMKVLVIGTGNPIEHDLDYYEYMNTVFDRTFVWHIYGQIEGE